uniref:Phorbol-ester/DAG-type domain-containing protein n=1 Tax=Sinocyclocheilus rhinocerous TaxID=307959 RepID=A0A673GPR9_9TELE
MQKPCAEKSGFIYHKGHEFIPLFYHFPANCEACTKPLWNMFKPPLALECQRCQIKCHKEHMDKKEESLRPCGNYLQKGSVPKPPNPPTLAAF